MAQQKVQLRKLRDFGENLSDTFQFIRQEFKPLATSFVLISGVFIMAQSVVAGLYEARLFSVFDDLAKGGALQPREISDVFSFTYFLVLALSLLTLTVMHVSIAAYMKYYDEHGNSPSFSEVWNGTKRYFIKVFFFSIPVYLLIIAGLILCLLPGIYFAVVLIPFPYVIVMEDASFGEAFNRCFIIVKENFWISLGIYFVTYLIYSFSSGIISFITGILAGLISYFSTKEIGSSAGIATSVINAVSYLFYIIYFISVALHYFNLAERTDGTGIARRLESIGSNINPNTNIEEQY